LASWVAVKTKSGGRCARLWTNSDIHLTIYLNVQNIPVISRDDGEGKIYDKPDKCSCMRKHKYGGPTWVPLTVVPELANQPPKRVI
jgi:hypothetical protein